MDELDLVLNCGSSSVKFAAYRAAEARPFARGIVERIRKDGTIASATVDGGTIGPIALGASDHRYAIDWVLGIIEGLGHLRSAGHRVVHGGARFTGSHLIDAEVLSALKQTVPLAPLHNPANLAGILALHETRPALPQVAVFDTAFHQTLPEAAYSYAVPLDWRDRFGFRRFGFHGTSHLYVTRRAAVLMKRPLGDLRMISLHIGNGVSLCASVGGRSRDTSMGFTPLEGAVMGTRSGDIDPGAIPYLAGALGVSERQVVELLNRESGLKGLCGTSDLRDVLARRDAGDSRATLALAVYVHRLRKYLGAYLATLGGADAVIFTAGVGERSAVVRQEILAGMEGLGLRCDLEANRSAMGEARISVENSTPIWVVPTDEERVIVEDTRALLRGEDPGLPGFRYPFES